MVFLVKQFFVFSFHFVFLLYLAYFLFVFASGFFMVKHFFGSFFFASIFSLHFAYFPFISLYIFAHRFNVKLAKSCYFFASKCFTVLLLHGQVDKRYGQIF